MFVVYFFCLMDPDLDPDSGSGSSDPIEFGSTALLQRVEPYRVTWLLS